MDNSQKVSLPNSKGINKKFCNPDYPSIANAPQYYTMHTLPVLLLFSFLVWCMHQKWKQQQDRQCAYNIILWCICTTIITMEMQQCSVFFHNSSNSIIFRGGKKTEHKMRALIFSTTFLENISFYKQLRERLP